MTLDIRPAVAGDLPALVALDSVTASEPSRGDEIAEWIADGSCFVALRNGKPVGYGVLHHHFFHRGMLDLVTVDPEHRRTGVGQALIRHAMTICQTPQLWTSTNQSNTIMQALLVRMGFVPSGMVEGLDIGDPELFFRVDTSAR